MNSYWQPSKCGGTRLHRFQLFRQFDGGSEEVCEICHKRKFFKIANGKLDNNTYLRWHFRDILQSNHPLYKREYGK